MPRRDASAHLGYAGTRVLEPTLVFVLGGFGPEDGGGPGRGTAGEEGDEFADTCGDDQPQTADRAAKIVVRHEGAQVGNGSRK